MKTFEITDFGKIEALRRLIMHVKFSNPTRENTIFARSTYIEELINDFYEIKRKTMGEPNLGSIDDNETVLAAVSKHIGFVENWNELDAKLRKEVLECVVAPFEVSEKLLILYCS